MCGPATLLPPVSLWVPRSRSRVPSSRMPRCLRRQAQKLMQSEQLLSRELEEEEGWAAQ